MKILIDIGHPAHVHLFKNFSWEMEMKGHEILFTVRDKEYEIQLLNAYGFKYISFGKHYRSKLGKIFGLFKFDLKMMQTVLFFNPDVLLSHGSVYAAQIAWLFRKPHISMEDSGNMEQIRLYRPFTKVILTPDVLPEVLGAKQIKYKAYHEIAYLRPNYYKPDDSIYKELNLNPGDKYCIIRFVSWNATHDEGHKGFSDEEKIILVNIVSKYLKVFISSESEITDELREYRISIPPERIHDALYFASLFIGEGATMASESGVLGTTAVYVNSIRRSYCEDQERFKLVLNFQNSREAIVKIKELIFHNENLCKQDKSKKTLLEEKIDLTAFLIWFVERYPESFRIMKNDPGYQLKFN